MPTHRETDRHRQAFETWYAADRDVGPVWKSLAVSDQAIYNWCNWFGWHARADRRDRDVAEKREREAIRRKGKMAEEHRQLGELIRRRAASHFAGRDFSIESTRDGLAAAKLGIEIERQAEGLPGYLVEVLNADPDELRRIIAADSGAAPPEGGAGDASAAGAGEAAATGESSIDA